MAIIEYINEGPWKNNDAAFLQAAGRAIPEVARHPQLMQDIRALSANAGLVEAPGVSLTGKGYAGIASMALRDGKPHMTLSADLLSRPRAEVRGVIGHELAHYVLGHNNNVRRQTGFEKFAMGAANLIGKIIPPLAPEMTMLHLRILRRSERDADKKGATIAGDVTGMQDFLRHHGGLPHSLGARIKSLQQERGDTHPRDSARIRALETFSRRHADEISRGAENLRQIERGQLGKSFGSAAQRAAPQPPRPSLGLSSGPSAQARSAPSAVKPAAPRAPAGPR